MVAGGYPRTSGDKLSLGLQANPVELSGLITAVAATPFAVVAFLFILFTYVGVSRLPPGLRSHAWNSEFFSR
ncbi:MAG TPA: hypothetical protein VN228_07120 [Pyrinomonadaceae bacterium]|nr:hypothetical protein [Pyrinomonadaceae bacterium]